MQWQKITLVGLGLLGGSLGLAIKKRRLTPRVAGYVRRPESVAQCEQLGVVDEAGCDLRATVTGADLVILCTPLGQMRGLVEQFRAALKPGALVTDVGSVKASVVRELEPLVRAAGAEFIGSHPMAGAEKMGVTAARADLFENAICVLTPTAASSSAGVQRLEDFWTAMGTRPLRLTPDEHDELVSRSSHLPHVIAAELANYVLSPAHRAEQAELCANGFRDTTRIASGSPEMWRDIAISNHRHLARVLGVFIGNLREFQHALEQKDAAAIQEFFAKAKERRDRWCGHGNSPE